MIYSLKERTPEFKGDNYFIAENASLIGSVILEDNVSIWFGAVLRADANTIKIGENSNIQDNCVLHVDNEYSLTIGKNVTVGHMAVVHGSTIGDGSLIGINAVILNGAKIGKNCLIASNTLVAENKVIPDNSLVMGTPGKVVKEITPEQLNMIKSGNIDYLNHITEYLNDLEKIN